jgi:hypothetical protein
MFCLHFAKGACIKGEECSFLHRTPELQDELRWEQTKDVFGRDKHENERDDKSGTGSFATNNRTLYVGHVPMTYKNTEAVVRKHFGQFGELESVRLLTGKAVAFIRFKSRLSAEFAREAMVGQTLDGKSKGKEILNVRWAAVDPNPQAQEAAKQSEYKKLLERVQAEQAMYYPTADYGTYSAEAVYTGQPQLTAGASVEAPEITREAKRKRTEVEIIADPEGDAEETEVAVITEYEPEEKTYGGSYETGVRSEVQQDPYQYPDTSAQIEAALETSAQAPALKKAKTAAAAAPATAPEANGGILSKDTLDALAKNASKIAQKKKEEKKAPALAMVGGYGSDEDEE